MQVLLGRYWVGPQHSEASRHLLTLRNRSDDTAGARHRVASRTSSTHVQRRGNGKTGSLVGFSRICSRAWIGLINLRSRSRIIWQDSLLSISYDRATPILSITSRAELRVPGPDGLSYVECMLQLCAIALDVVNGRSLETRPKQEALRIEERWRGVSTIEEQACNHLRDSSACTSMKDHLEHWNWRMHRSYIITEVCRPILSKHGRHDDVIRRLRAACIEALADTVDAFLHLHNLTAFARTSWTAVHRSLGSALLLGILKEPTRNERVRIMLDKLIAAMLTMEYFDVSDVPAPIRRAVDALTRLNRAGESARGEAASSTESVSDEASPHAQMNHILWGPPSADLPPPWGSSADEM